MEKDSDIKNALEYIIDDGTKKDDDITKKDDSNATANEIPINGINFINIDWIMLSVVLDCKNVLKHHMSIIILRERSCFHWNYFRF